MKNDVIRCCFFACLAFSGFAQTPEALFAEANGLYEKGNYGQAIEKYGQLLSQGFHSAELHYNLGNAYFRQKNLGKAILHFERAAILDPTDADIQHNLAFARKQVKGEVQALPEFFLLRGWRQMRMLAHVGHWGLAAIVLWWAGFVGFGVWLMGKTRPQKKKGFVMGAACLLLSFLPFALAMSRHAFEKDSRLAIVVLPTASLRSAPDEAGTEILLLYEGAKVSLSDQIGDWYKVRLPDGETGWLPEAVVEKI